MNSGPSPFKIIYILYLVNVGLFVHIYSTIPPNETHYHCGTSEWWSIRPTSSNMETKKITLHRDIYHVTAHVTMEFPSRESILHHRFCSHHSLFGDHQPSSDFSSGSSRTYTWLHLKSSSDTTCQDLWGTILKFKLLE